MPFRIVDYSGNDIFLVSMATSTIAQFRRDYLDLGAGIEYGLTNNVALYLDIRLEAFGKPDSANFPIVEATGGQTLPITFGIDYRFWK